MIFRHFALAAALMLAVAVPAVAKDNWIGARGFVPTPLCPGLTPALPLAASLPVEPVTVPDLLESR